MLITPVRMVALGRGATDYVAVALAAMLKCPVRFRKGSGKISAIDPEIFSDARKIDHMTIGQAKNFVEYSNPERQFLMLNSLELAAFYHVPLYFLPGPEHNFQGTGTAIGVAHEVSENDQFNVESFKALVVQDVYVFELTIPHAERHSLYEQLRNAGVEFGDFYGSGSQVVITVNEKNLGSAIGVCQSCAPHNVYQRSSLTYLDSSIVPESEAISGAENALRGIDTHLELSFGSALRFIVDLKDQHKAVCALAIAFDL